MRFFKPQFAHTGIRQGKRLAHQKRKGMLDFSASERCIKAIKARLKRA